MRKTFGVYRVSLSEVDTLVKSVRFKRTTVYSALGGSEVKGHMGKRRGWVGGVGGVVTAEYGGWTGSEGSGNENQTP